MICEGKAQGTVIDSAEVAERDSILNEVAQMKWRKKLILADNLLESGSSLTAILVYEMALKDKPEDTYVLNKLGETNYFMRHYEHAAKWLDSLVALDSLEYPYSQYYLAKSLKYLGRYDGAIKEFNKFHATVFPHASEEMVNAKSTVDREIQGCKLGMEMMENPVKVKVEHLEGGVNHPLTDLSPRAIAKTKMLYAALAAESPIDIKKEDTLEGRYTRLYVAELEGEEWKKTGKYDFDYNKGAVHVGNGALSPDGKRLYYTQCEEQDDLSMLCHIYESTRTDTGWTVPVMLAAPVNLEDYSSSHPMVASQSGTDVLYFASNIPGGLGGTDIYRAFRNKETGTFDEVENLRDDINTADDEFTPFFDTTWNTLYFSSDGRVSMGGFDIYSSELDSAGNWSEPVNLGYPVNSSVDDIYYAMGPKKRSGFLVTNRPGGLSPKSPTCCDDIWSFKYPPAYVFLETTVLEEGSDKPVPEGEVYIYQADNDSLLGTVDINENGKFRFKLPGGKKYRVEAKSLKYEDAEISVNTEFLDDGEVVNKQIFMKKRPYWEGLNVGIVYYDFDKSKLRESARPVLDTLVEILKSYPRMIIEIAGHTDNMGDTVYNKKLSERRAESVFYYLKRKGIPEEQMVQKGYGETMPVAPNKNPDGSDNPEGRQLNRRVEFKVVGELEDVPDKRRK